MMSGARGWTARLVIAVLVGTAVWLVPEAASAAALTATVKVAAGSSLNVRSGPSTSYPVIRRVRNGSALRIVCQTPGQMVSGTVRRSSAWDRLTDGRYVADAFIVWPARQKRVPRCAMVASAQVANLLNQRSNASTLRPPLATIRAGTLLRITCQLDGESVRGTARTSSLWDRLSNGNFVADAYVGWPGDGRPAVPWCSFMTRPAPAVGAPFVNWVGRYAKATDVRYRVPASVTIAQAILESGWGRSSLTVDGNAYFGVKCFGSPGGIAVGCRPYRTSECSASRCFPTSATFRVYTTVWTSFKDHGRLLARNPRYRNAFKYTNNPNRFAVEIHRAGYATSPTYAQNLIKLMRKYDLYRFDA